MKREHVLSWDEYFMGLAHLSAMRSKDPSTQVGAVIVDQEHKVVGIGYNGLRSAAPMMNFHGIGKAVCWKRSTHSSFMPN